MIKKITFMGVALIMCLGIFSGCGNRYIYKVDDFRLVVSADKKEADIGETITITAKFENLSGNNVPIRMSFPIFEKLEDALSIGIFKEGEEHHFEVASLAGPRKKMQIKKDAMIEKTMEFRQDEVSDYEIAACIVFQAEKNYSKRIAIYSETITISVK